jgi:hypothetical protein
MGPIGCLSNRQYITTISHFMQSSTLPLLIVHCTLLHVHNSCGLHCFQFMGACPAHSPLLGNIRSKRTSDNTREFHSKVVINDDVTIYVNSCSILNIAPTNRDCEGFSIPHSLFFLISCSIYQILPRVYIICIKLFYINYT